ncbi:5,10-methylenetetrahydrofolate reductase [Pseudomonas syringae pv. actinidiae]|uniref:5,10-methylenetetrahydrofolate reductase n=1 Tax=Pseudomonas syringae pv. actinidiae TaxID=103796 RepID=A0A2V0QN97_PSESF|nr:5,10-methylenetetrahydrofolate reductase [Pseudomonas syringae pv. actinidiae]
MHVFLRRCFGMFMNDQLMAVKIKVHPLRTGTPLGKPENFTVESPGGGQVIHRDCQVKRRKAHQNSGYFFRIQRRLQRLRGVTAGLTLEPS